MNPKVINDVIFYFPHIIKITTFTCFSITLQDVCATNTPIVPADLLSFDETAATGLNSVIPYPWFTK